MRNGAIGDTIVLFPLLAELRRRFPRAHVTAIGRSEVFEIAREDGLCDRALHPDAAGNLDSYERVFDLDALPPADFAAPAAKFYLEKLGWSEAPPFVFSPREAHGDALVVVPGAGSPRKRAPASWFAEISRRAKSRCVLVAGEADEKALAEFAAAGGRCDERWIGLPLPELAEKLRGARAFVANDSGIAHLAAYVGLRGVVRFVASDPRVWGPQSPRVYCSALGDPPELAAVVL